MSTNSQVAVILAASAIAGCGVAWWAANLLTMVHRPVAPADQIWQLEERRRSRLRAASGIYRWCEPLVDEASRAGWLHAFSNLAGIERSLRRGATGLPWTAAEYSSVRLIWGLILGGTLGAALWCAQGLATAAWATITCALWVFLTSARRVAAQAEQRLIQVKRRLPFAVDLMALMMEAGGDFRQCLGIVVQENRDHPVGEEFGKLLREYCAGQPLRESLDALAERLRDDDISEMAFSVKTAENLGTPLSKTFLTLAEQMRLKQSQLSEKVIGQRKTMLAFPALIVMIACLVIAVAPFVLGSFLGSPD